MVSNIYWIEGLPGGRLGIVGRPRSGDWLEDEILGWRSAGLTDVVSLLEDHELRELDLLSEGEVAARIGLSFERFPIPDRGVPQSVDLALDLWKRLVLKLREGRSVGIHCRAGIGRSGLMVAGVLCASGIPEGAAWQRTCDARGLTVPDTEAQRQWVSQVMRKRTGRT